MTPTDIDRVLGDLETLADQDAHLAAPPRVEARVMAQWDERGATAPLTLRWWNYLGLAGVCAAAVWLAAAIPPVAGTNQHYTTGTSGSEIALADGSRVEMRAASALSVEHTAKGIRIQLARGSIIVNAAEQRDGHLSVQTRDMSVSVEGTVFLVNVEEKGSRVAVIEGEVRVQHGDTAQRLGPGEQVLTGATLQPNTLRQEIAWSRRAESLARLLQAASQRAPEVVVDRVEEAPAQDAPVEPLVAQRSTDTARSGRADPARQRLLEEAMTSRAPATGLSLSVATSYRQLNRAEYSVPVTVRIAPGKELTVGRGERSMIDVMVQVTDLYGTVMSNLRDEITLFVAAERLSTLATTPIVYETAFTLLPGTYTVRAVLLDQTTGRIGAADAKFVVPNLNRVPAN